MFIEDELDDLAMEAATFVFFDIETTGLPHLERNHTRVTELTFLAAAIADIVNTPYAEIPPVSKLSLLFEPQQNILPETTEITKLSNDMLKNQPIFEKKIKTLNSFLEELPKPVCLVAHNGNIFDYKIFRAEYLYAKASLPDGLLCVDSLIGFRKILKETNLMFKDLKANACSESSGEDSILTDNEDWPELNTSKEEWDEIDKMSLSFTTFSTEHRRSIPDKQIKTISNKINSPKKPRVSYTLPALYKRLMNRNAEHAHRAEADCYMLLECVVALKEYFLPWANAANKPISQIEPLKRY